MTNNDPKLDQMGKILSVISNGKDIAKATENMINQNPAEEYPIPTDVLLSIVASLRANANLAANLFEENQSITDRIEKLLEKFNSRPEK